MKGRAEVGGEGRKEGGRGKGTSPVVHRISRLSPLNLSIYFPENI